MTLPNILISGGPKTLLIDLEKSREALDTARIALVEATPHPRDYVNFDSYQTAFQEHITRIEALIRIEDELITIIGHLIKGGAR